MIKWAMSFILIGARGHVVTTAKSSGEVVGRAPTDICFWKINKDLECFFILLCVRKCLPELFWRGETACLRTPFNIRLWDIYIRLWDQNSSTVSCCVFIFWGLKVSPTPTPQKNVVERFWGYRVLERIKTHRLRPTPALYDPQTYEFFRFYEKKPFSIFDVYPSYFDRIPDFFDQNLERVSAHLLYF